MGIACNRSNTVERSISYPCMYMSLHRHSVTQALVEKSRSPNTSSSRSDPDYRLGESTGANPPKHTLENACIPRMCIVYVNRVKNPSISTKTISCEDIQKSISSLSSTSIISLSFSVVDFCALALVIVSRKIDAFFPFGTGSDFFA